jgi:hypothetical protein
LDGGYSPYGTEQHQFGQQLRQGQHPRLGEQQLGRGSAGSFGDAGHKQQQQPQQQQAKQKGRLGRMASRIYALRPRMLRGELRQHFPINLQFAPGTFRASQTLCLTYALPHILDNLTTSPKTWTSGAHSCMAC